MNFEKSPFADSTEESVVVLHIGGPKCGSSSLQTFLTQNPKMQTMSRQKIEYWAIRTNEQLKNQYLFYQSQDLECSPIVKYVDSNFSEDELEINCLHEIFRDFISVNSQDEKKIFVFSSESWTPKFQNANKLKCTCENENFKILIYLSVRPQIDMLVPSYLQWLVWSDTPTLEETFLLLQKVADWAKQIENASALGADGSIVRYSKDIVEDFCNTFEIDNESIQRPLEKKINRSLPLEAITLLLRNRVLRPGVHSSEMEFLIENYLNDFDVKTESVVLRVPPELIKEIESYFQESNLRLTESLSEEQAIAYKAKSIASKSELLKGNGIEDLFSHQIDPKFIEQFLVALLVESRNQIYEKESVVAERDSVVAERDSILNSTIWKVFKAYRWSRNKL